MGKNHDLDGGVSSKPRLPEGNWWVSLQQLWGCNRIWDGIHWDILLPKDPPDCLYSSYSGSDQRNYLTGISPTNFMVASGGDTSPCCNTSRPMAPIRFFCSVFTAYSNLHFFGDSGIPSVWRNPHLMASTPYSTGWLEAPKIGAKERSWSIARLLVSMRNGCWW